jgi:hypothetical protein
MSSQTFRRPIPVKLLFDLFDQICLKTDKYYLVDMNSYKKMMYLQLHIPFIEDIVDYYHAAKQFYVRREMSYNSFVNIVRQACVINGLTREKQVRYTNSKYTVEYLLYLPDATLAPRPSSIVVSSSDVSMNEP